jgi:hypothetical protein
MRWEIKTLSRAFICLEWFSALWSAQKTSHSQSGNGIGVPYFYSAPHVRISQVAVAKKWPYVCSICLKCLMYTATVCIINSATTFQPKIITPSDFFLPCRNPWMKILIWNKRGLGFQSSGRRDPEQVIQCVYKRGSLKIKNLIFKR